MKKPELQRDRGKLQILYASQSGNAQSIAEQTAQQLTQTGEQFFVSSLNNWQEQHGISALNGKIVLFVVSTQGEGDPPDNAIIFFRQLRTWQGDLSSLRFAVLGLGDLRYTHFCGFAHDLYQHLKNAGGEPLFPTVTVNQLDNNDLSRWQQHLNTHFSGSIHYDMRQSLMHATLIKRHCENPDSPALPLFSLQLALPNLSKPVNWQAGDIAEITIPSNEGELLRSYTLANVPTNTPRTTPQQLSLLVRQVQKDSGALGIGSGYLTNTLSISQAVTLSIRRNPNFHLSASPTPLVLIATGSGLAGILALLQQAKRDWGTNPSHHLIYGERHPDADTPCRKQLTEHKKSGLLDTIDYCFSRSDTLCYRYVQDALLNQAERIKSTINHGAMVYVCGSKNTLSESIPAVLSCCLGDSAYQQLIARNGLRLDVY